MIYDNSNFEEFEDFENPDVDSEDDSKGYYRLVALGIVVEKAYIHLMGLVIRYMMAISDNEFTESQQKILKELRVTIRSEVVMLATWGWLYQNELDKNQDNYALVERLFSLKNNLQECLKEATADMLSKLTTSGLISLEENMETYNARIVFDKNQVKETINIIIGLLQGETELTVGEKVLNFITALEAFIHTILKLGQNMIKSVRGENRKEIFDLIGFNLGLPTKDILEDN